MGNHSIYGRIRNRILEESSRIESAKRFVRGAWTLKLAYQPNPEERLFQYDVSIIQIREQGSAYSFAGESSHESLKSFINKDAALCIPENPSCYGVAVLDALCGSVQTAPSASFQITGTSDDKAKRRAEIIAEEVGIIACRLSKKKARICNVGAIGNVVKTVSDAGHDVSVTDLEPGLIGKELYGSEVLDGSRHTIESVAKSDIAIVTGMTFANGAIDEIVETARTSNTEILLVAETGAWVGHRFIEEAGISAVVCEPFPFYIFSGSSTINIHRRK